MNRTLTEHASGIRLQADMSKGFWQRRWVMRVIW